MSAYEVAEHVGVVDDHLSKVFVALLPDGPITTLSHVAAELWRFVVSGVSIDDMVAAVVEDEGDEAESTPEMIRAGIEAFLGDLVDRGLLREVQRG